MGFITSAFLLTTAVIVFLPLIVKHMSSNCLDDLDIGDMSGKVVIITGANAGLGYYTTLELAKNNAVIIMGCRSTKRCETAKANILKEAPQAKLETMDLDVASFKSVRNFVNKFLEVHKAVDVLVNNAGIMAVAKHTLTEDGLESQLATNHFGHFLLTGLLFPHISKNGRVVNHSSMGHALATKNFPFSHLQTTEEEYMPWRIYGNTKLANLYFTFELNKRLQRSGNPRNIMSVAVHPGYSATNLQVGKYPFWKQLNGMVGMHAGDGAMSQVYAASGRDVQPSENTYIGPFFRLFGCPTVQATQPNSWNTTNQRMLWDESEKITSITFDFDAVATIITGARVPVESSDDSLM